MPNVNRLVLFVLLVLFFMGGLSVDVVVGQTVAEGGEAAKAWMMDISGTVNGSPGLGSSKAIGAGASIALVRSTYRGTYNRESVGVVASADVLTDPADDPGDRVEQWFLAGPRLDYSNQEGISFLHVVGGVKRLTPTGTGGSRQDAAAYAAIGAGFGFSIPPVVMAFDFRATPADQRSRYRLMISVGVLFDVRLRTKTSD